jgi:uncharacterized protein (TIRG00374 family)
MNKKILGGLLITIFTLITIYILFTSDEIENFPHIIKILDIRYLLLAISFMLLYLVVNSTIIYIIGKEITPNISYFRAVNLSFIGQYYSLITPLASGGQPAQVIEMKTKYDVPLMKATTLTVKKFIIYQVVVSIYAIIMFFIRYEFILNTYGNIVVFIIIGLLFNLISGIIIVLLAYTDIFVKKIGEFILKLMHKLRLFKNLTKDELFFHIDDYVKNIDDIKNNKKKMVILVILTFIQLTIYFSITYWIYLAFKQEGATYLDILSIQTIIYVVVSFIPTPGGAGATEGTFYILFKAFFNRGVLLYAMALSRLIVYYGNIVLSGSFIIGERVYNKIKVRSIKSVS